MRIFVLLLLFLMSQTCFANSFGRYKYSNSPLLLQQQLRYNQMMGARRQAAYNYYSNPTRNIRYPNRMSAYPNIERNSYNYTNTRQGYSFRY